MIEIRKANILDMPIVFSLFDAARQIMWNNGNRSQWSKKYPSYTTIENDINNDQCFLCLTDGIIVASFTFSPGPERTYATIYDGYWINNDLPYHVIHRIASNGMCHGIFSSILNFCQGQASNIRIDTHRDNKIMRHCLEKYGFTFCGIIYVADGSERLAFQKIIN